VQQGVTITAETIQPRWHAGDRLDLDHAVAALCQLEPPFDN
jgi:hypothetical protein